MMSFWIIIVGSIGFFLAIGVYMSNQAGKKAAGIIRRIDQKYDDYINKYLSYSITHGEDQDIDHQELCDKLLVVLKPEVESLVAHMNTTDISGVKISYKSPYFQNVARISEELFEKRNKYKDTPLNKEDSKKLYTALVDAIEADLTQKLLNLKTGKF